MKSIKNKLKLGLTALVAAGMLAVAGCKHTAPDTSGDQYLPLPVDTSCNQEAVTEKSDPSDSSMIRKLDQDGKVVGIDRYLGNHLVGEEKYTFDCNTGVMVRKDEVFHYDNGLDSHRITIYGIFEGPNGRYVNKPLQMQDFLNDGMIRDVCYSQPCPDKDLIKK